MKHLTKEWLKDMELNELRNMFTESPDQKLPLIFTNGGAEGIAKKDLHTVKTKFNLTEKENEINFVLVPDTFYFYPEYRKSATEPDRKSAEEDFLVTYSDRLRIISSLPDEILKLIKDKRLLALGYAERAVKKALLEYLKDKTDKALDTLVKSCEASVKAESGLAVFKQFGENVFVESIVRTFDQANIIGADTVGEDIYLELDANGILVLKGAEIICQETEVKNSYVRAMELHKNKNGYELHLLLMKRDENFVPSFYYATYKFKDMIFKV